MRGLTYHIYKHGIDLPRGINEVVCALSDGYMICLNNKLTESEKKHEYYHALMHIIHGDFESPDVKHITRLTHRICNCRWEGKKHYKNNRRFIYIKSEVTV